MITVVSSILMTNSVEMKVWFAYFSVFAVDSMTGQIFLTGNLDYEKQRKYKYTAKASDDGGLFSEAVISILICSFLYNFDCCCF